MKDCWIENNAIFVCDGHKYGIAPDGLTVWCGQVEVSEKPTDAPQALPGGEEVVLQHPIKGKVLDAPKQEVVLQQKHHGGRPQKEGEVHRTTEWRRKKESQGVLI